MTTCKLCGQPLDGPAYDARAKGFDPQVHCALWANNEGGLISCWGVMTLGFQSCHRCPVYKKNVVELKDKFGRTREMWKRKGEEHGPV